MSKQILSDVIAETHGVSKAVAGDIVSTVLDTIVDHVASSGSFQIPGFGSFAVSHRAARNGRNPQTGEPMNIAAATVPRFSAGTKFKEAVAAKAKKAKSKK